MSDLQQWKDQISATYRHHQVRFETRNGFHAARVWDLCEDGEYTVFDVIISSIPEDSEQSISSTLTDDDMHTLRTILYIAANESVRGKDYRSRAQTLLNKLFRRDTVAA